MTPSRRQVRPTRAREAVGRHLQVTPPSRGRTRAGWRLFSGVLLSVAGFLWLAPAGAPAPPRSAARAATVPAVATDAVAGVTNDPDGVTLLAQSAFVEAPAGVFRMRVKVAARDPADDVLRVNVYGRLTTRTGFDEALTGHPGGYVIYPLTVPVSKLPADPAGGVDVDIPINQAASDPNIPIFYASAGSGVFPVQVGITDLDGNPQGRPLLTYLVYAEPYPASGLPKLSVAVVVPVHGAPTVDANGQIGAADRRSIGSPQ